MAGPSLAHLLWIATALFGGHALYRYVATVVLLYLLCVHSNSTSTLWMTALSHLLFFFFPFSCFSIIWGIFCMTMQGGPGSTPAQLRMIAGPHISSCKLRPGTSILYNCCVIPHTCFVCYIVLWNINSVHTLWCKNSSVSVSYQFLRTLVAPSLCAALFSRPTTITELIYL